MEAERWRQMWQIFEQAAELPAKERSTFLEAACSGSSKLRQTIEELLKADAEESPLDHSPMTPASKEVPFEARHQSGSPKASLPQPNRPQEELLLVEPQEIGPYRLVRRLGQGGMGVVYLAQRHDDTFKRRVVIKLVRPGMEREDLLRRLRAERQILAALDHPGIARLTDSGSTADGLPYFVMEYVEGTPIDQYCNQNRLDIPARLRLFRKVCEAVEYAHRNLVVHRDLKPSNILVTAEGDAKLLDFGIAKLLNPELLAPDLEPTMTWQRVLTPSYASPEQLRGGPITTASDVYSLGVLLYRLLTGRLPYRLAGRTPPEIERTLMEKEPPRPSAAVAQADPSVTKPTPGANNATEPSAQAIATARRTNPPGLARRLSGDLDAIVLKAMRPAALERFGSVESLSEDLDRHLNGLPVAARKGTRRYLAGRFLSRHRTAAASFAGLITFLLVFAGLMAWQSSRLADERDKVRASRDAKENVLQLMLDIFRVADPFAGDGAGESLTVRTALERSGPLLERRLRGQPAQRAEILQATGLIYRNLGLLDLSEERLETALELRRALSSTSPERLTIERAESLTTLADVLLIQGRGEEALALVQEAVTETRALAIDPAEGSTSALMKPLNGLVGVLCALKEYPQAEPLASEALELAQSLPDKDPLRPVALLQMAAVQNGLQRHEEAVDLYRQALALQQAILGDRHPSLTVTLNNLGVALRRLDRFEEAAQSLEETLEIQKEHLGEHHPKVAATLNNLGGVAEARGEASEAMEYFQRASEILREKSGPDNPRLLLLQVRIHSARLQKGQPEIAERGLRQDLVRWRDALGSEHRYVLKAERLLAKTLVAQGRLREAEAIHLDLLSRAEPEDRKGLQERFLEVYRSWGYPQEATRFERQLESPTK